MRMRGPAVEIYLKEQKAACELDKELGKRKFIYVYSYSKNDVELRKINSHLVIYANKYNVYVKPNGDNELHRLYTDEICNSIEEFSNKIVELTTRPTILSTHRIYIFIYQY